MPYNSILVFDLNSLNFMTDTYGNVITPCSYKNYRIIGKHDLWSQNHLTVKFNDQSAALN